MKQHLIDFYLDWVNNFISTSGMAEHYGLDETMVIKLINIGRTLHEREVANG